MQPYVFLNGALQVSTDDLGSTGDYTWREGDDWPSFHFRLKDGDALHIVGEGRRSMVATMHSGKFRNGLTALCVSAEKALDAEVRVYRSLDRLPSALVIVLPRGAALRAAEDVVRVLVRESAVAVPFLVREAGPDGDAREAAWRLGHEQG